MNADLKCGVCGELLGAHVPTESGPLTHPREARGEGTYELVHHGYTMGRGPALDDLEVPPAYRFVPKERQ